MIVVSPTRIVAALLAATLLNLIAAGLLLLVFREVGIAAFTPGRHVGWVLLALPLAGAFASEAAASACGGLAGAMLTTQLRRRSLTIVLNCDPDRTRRLGTGDAQALTLDLDLIGSFLVSTGPAALLGVAQLLAGSYALTFAPRPTLSLAVVAAAALTTAGMAALLMRARQRWTEQRRSLTGRLVERLVGQRTVSIQDIPTRTETEGRTRARHYRLASLRMDRTQGLQSGIPSLTLAILIAVIASHPTHPLTSTVTGLGASLLIASGLSMVIASTSDAAAARDALRGLSQLKTMTLRAPVPAEAAIQQHPGRHDPILQATRITATYGDQDTGLATPVDLTISLGDRIMLVGPSGCGKTTLAEVLSGRRPPSTGHVALRHGATISRVPQAGDDHVFHASLLFNLLCARPWPPQSEDIRRVQSLIRELELEDLVARMPAGLGQPVGDGGWRLSSGERARISLARALITEPDLLILDETTAALDPITARTLLSVAQRHTPALVLIAHP